MNSSSFFGIAVISPMLAAQLVFGAPGDVDASFDPSVNGSVGSVLALTVQPDGKILLGGQFSRVAGQQHMNIVRLNADGSPEGMAGFNPGTGPDTQLRCIGVQPDGKIVIGEIGRAS